MMTLIPIEPLDDGHGALIVEAFGRFLIDGGGEPDGYGDGPSGFFDSGGGWGGRGDGWGDGWGDGFGGNGPIPDEWRVDTHAIPCKP